MHPLIPSSAQCQCWERRNTYHSLAALVLGDLVLGLVVVHLVDNQRRVRDLLGHPVQVLLDRLGHDDLERVVATCRLGRPI